MNRKTALKAIIISALLVSLVAGMHAVKVTKANFIPIPAVMAMPEEYVNVTISQVNGTLWAKVDTTYLLHRVYEEGVQNVSGKTLYVWDLMDGVYPIPPNAVDFSLKASETSVRYYNASSDFKTDYLTVLGYWPCATYSISPLPENFSITTHYEQLLSSDVGNFTFIYPMITRPYLTEGNNRTTTYISLRMDVDLLNMHAFVIEAQRQWVSNSLRSPLGFSSPYPTLGGVETNPNRTLWSWKTLNSTTTSENGAKTLGFEIESEYSGTPLWDVIVSNNPSVQELTKLPLPSPTQTPRPNESPSPSSSTSPTSSPSLSPTPSPSPSPTITPTSTPMQSPTPLPSFTGNPTSTPNATQAPMLSQEVVYGAVFSAAFIIIAVLVLVVRRRKQPKLS